jgi:hypothetical protein
LHVALGTECATFKKRSFGNYASAINIPSGMDVI